MFRARASRVGRRRAPSLPFHGALVPHGCDHTVGHRRVGGEIGVGLPEGAPKAGIEHLDRESRLRRRGGTGTAEGTIYNVAIVDSPTSRRNLTIDDADIDAVCIDGRDLFLTAPPT